MIGFVSAGFNPPMTFTKEELDFLDSSELILVDTYTSPNYLRELGERELNFVGRDKLEDYQWILKIKGTVSIVIPGDSFSATTHFSIYMEAIKKGIKVRVFHNSSIFPTAATRLGLHLYKVGPAVSLPRFKEKFRPLSPYDKIKDNSKRGLHTILLLDTEPPLELKDALEELLWMESEKNEGLLDRRREVGILSSLGTPDEKIVYGRIETMMEWKGGTVPFTIVIPAELHFQEKEALDLFHI
ncbi:MAG: diphthine synthase [Candidatus Thermoplasmatota archaeon]|jgi:diphthine synthase|nr:diphthine synthase [Candidatus Thermoplasmatota archaeon]